VTKLDAFIQRCLREKYGKVKPRRAHRKKSQRAIFATKAGTFVTDTPEKLNAFRLFMRERLSKHPKYLAMLHECTAEYDAWAAHEKSKQTRGRPRKPNPVVCGWKAGDNGIISRKKPKAA